MDPRFTVIDITSPDPDGICHLLKEQLHTSNSSARLAPLTQVANIVAQLGAQSALIQLNVQDPDFLSEHAAYYAKWSTKIPRYCTRVHFFSASAGNTDALEFIDTMADMDSTPYLGFVTLRPISMSPLAATILAAPTANDNHFIISTDEFDVNLAGQRFTIKGTPFLQQDNAVGACAQASIWMALRTLRRKEGQSAYSPAQITTAATRFLVNGRTLPNRSGLRLEQITEAVRTAGFSPHLIPLRNDEQATPESLLHAKRSLYPYVESGIPVILAVIRDSSGHAVLMIGHGWTETPAHLSPIYTPSPDSGSNFNVYDASSWVEPFIIHNDNSGPYLPLKENDNETYCLADAVNALPLLPADVFIDGNEARKACFRLLIDILNTSQRIDLPDFVIRTYLRDRSDFRKSVLKSNMSDQVKRYYREKWLPKRIWVMEINAFENYQEAPKGTTIRLGEVLLDPSSEPTEGHFLTIHLTPTLVSGENTETEQGIIIDRNAFEGEIEGRIVQENQYGPHLSLEV